MVRVGNHSVCLVDAKTDLPLKEFQHQGKTWVVGQPGQEYWISVTSFESSKKTLSGVRVDGKIIGERIKHYPKYAGQSTKMGAVIEHGSQRVALQFASQKQCEPSHPSRTSQNFVGTIDLFWHEFDAVLRPNAPAYSKTWHGNVKATAADNKKEGVGALQSQIGSSKMQRSAPTRYMAKRGKHLYGTKIYYCEAAGLVARGIVTHQQLVDAGVVGQGGHDDEDETEEDVKPFKRRKRGPKKPQAVSETIDLTQSDGAVVPSFSSAISPVVPDEAKSSQSGTAAAVEVKAEVVGSSIAANEDVVDLT